MENLVRGVFETAQCVGFCWRCVIAVDVGFARWGAGILHVVDDGDVCVQRWWRL